MEFKVPDFVKKLFDHNLNEKVDQCLEESCIDNERIDEKIIDSIVERITVEEVEKFKILFHELKIDINDTDKEILDVRYLVQELNKFKKALQDGTTRGKLKYIPGQMEIKYIERHNQLEEILKFQEESEIRKFGLLDQISFQDAEIKRLKSVIKDLRNKLFGKEKEIRKLEKVFE